MVAMATETVKPGSCDYSDSIKATYFKLNRWKDSN